MSGLRRLQALSHPMEVVDSTDAALLRCLHCGWTFRGWDVPSGRSAADVLAVHQQGACLGTDQAWNDAAAEA